MYIPNYMQTYLPACLEASGVTFYIKLVDICLCVSAGYCYVMSRSITNFKLIAHIVPVTVVNVNHEHHNNRRRGSDAGK